MNYSSKKKVVFICKTNLNNDGRVLNQMKILKNHFGKALDLSFILLADSPTSIDTDAFIDDLYTVDCAFRNSKLLRFFTVLEFSFKALLLLYRLKPSILHVQDSAVVLPCFVYSLLVRKKCYVIYDDHELPNENEGIQNKIFDFFENKLIARSDYVLFANREREVFLREKLRLSVRSDYFLNLPYYSELTLGKMSLESDNRMKLDELERLKHDGFGLIIHQGSLETERGREKLANFSKRCVDKKIKIVILGVRFDVFENFLIEFNLDCDTFKFIGIVDYEIIEVFWNLCDACIIMYLPTYINNKLCAPNRYFIAVANNIPTIVNKDNPVLLRFTEDFNSGYFIEDFLDSLDINEICNHSYDGRKVLDNLIQYEKKKFIDFYSSIK